MTDQNTTPETAVSRRELLATTGSIGTVMFAGCSSSAQSSEMNEVTPKEETRASTRSRDNEHSSPQLEKWIDEIPRPAVAESAGTKNGQPYYELTMGQFKQQFHSDLPSTTVWGMNGLYPGPTIEATQGEPIYVRWRNQLPEEHLLPIDTSIHGDMIPYDSVSEARVVMHLHGGNIETESDGKPDAWFTPNFEETGPAFVKKDYYYQNEQPPTTLWYHDHTLGITRLNVYAGLAGFYIIRNEHERNLGLPTGKNEIPLAIQDKSFTQDGSLYYPTVPESGGNDSLPSPSIIPQFYGDVSVVNGKAWPRLSVDPGKYRFRLLAASNSRFYRLKLLTYDESTGKTGKGGPSFVQIGNDGGLLETPHKISGRLEIGPSKRADVVVDFSEFAGQTLLLHNDAPAMYRGKPADGSMGTEPLPEIMLIDVANVTGANGSPTESGLSSRVPKSLTTVPAIPVESVTRQRYLPLVMQSDEYGRPLNLLGNEQNPNGLRMHHPVTETPTLGDTEIWSFANLTGMSHPIHLHLVHFQILGREPFGDYDPQSDTIDMSSLEPPKPYEMGWNDVVTVDPAEVVHVIAHFGEFEGLFTDQTGGYMWHCHMIEHEDHDMMRPFEVLSKPSENSNVDGNASDSESDTSSSTDDGREDATNST